MVPVEEEDVRNTMNVLLKSPNEAGIVAVALKRKKQFKNKHKRRNMCQSPASEMH